MDAMTTDRGDLFASARRFPTTLPAPGTGGGAELGAPVRLYGEPAGPWPAPATGAPAVAPPVVASGAGGPGRLAAAWPAWRGCGGRGGRLTSVAANDRLCATRC